MRSGDLLLARLLAKRPFRMTLYATFALTAAGALLYRVIMGRGLQVLPWPGALLSLYFLGMAVASTDVRCRAAHVSFAVLVAATFTRGFLLPYARAVGAVEVVSCLVLLALLWSLHRDAGFMARGAVLESRTPQKPG